MVHESASPFVHQPGKGHHEVAVGIASIGVYSSFPGVSCVQLLVAHISQPRQMEERSEEVLDGVQTTYRRASSFPN